MVANHQDQVFQKQRTQYHKCENYIGTSAVQDLQKELQRQTSAFFRTLAEDHTALIRDRQPRAKCKPDALSAKPHNWSHISGKQKLNRPTASFAGISMRLSDLPPPVVRGASIITETAAAHSHNPDTTNRPAATERFTTTSSLTLLDHETTQATKTKRTGNEAHNYCGINQ